jgi:ribose/xylose/arabinose/galactoside ABC-type transport system permease subunit
MTRSEILTAVSAALFFAAVLVWRLGPIHVAVASLALIAVWVVITLLWLRRRSKPARDEAFAASGVEFYRRELERRRIHLRNTWLWHGPVLLACIALIAVAIGTGNLAYKRLTQASPLIMALAVWTIFSIRQRLREADAIKRELDEMAEASRHGRE